MAAKSSMLAETVANAATVKSLGLEPEMERRWGSRLALSAWTGFRSNNLANTVNAVGTGLQHLVGLAIIFVGAHSIMAGEMSIGALVAAGILASRALAPIRHVVAAWSQLQEARAAFRRIDAIFNEATEKSPRVRTSAVPLYGKVELEDVAFGYDPTRSPVLRGIDLALEPGTIVGITGPSGSGKSTLAKLIQGLYAPDSGRVLIDDTDMRHLSRTALHRQLAVVPQEVQLFAGAIRDNIAMGLTLEDPMRVVSAAKFVGAHDFIERLPEGYDTVLSERGGGLSAGQRQLLCVARAVIRNPRILILDEATGALDAASEKALLDSLKRAARSRTIIIVSHRPAPLRIANHVALMVDGRIARIGAPDEVIAPVTPPREPRTAGRMA
jgi:ABC-type bacteriocin/lantibiotic exporter with double-glycine peptidase domain